MTVDVDVRFTWWHFFISSYYLSVSNEISFTALKSAEFTQSSGSFNWGGGPSAFGVYIFSLCAGMSLFDCFKWALIDCIVKCRGHSELWQFQKGMGSICLWCLHVFSMHWYFLISSYYLTVSNGHSLTALKSVEVIQSSGSFKWGGSICLWCLHIFSMCWYVLVWLFQMGAHWLHCKV